MKSSVKSAAFAGALLGLAATAQAHQVWIEQPAGQGAVLRFGEYGENLREVSPGLLDKFGAPTATLISASGEKTGAGVKTATGYTLPFTAGERDAIVAEDPRYPLSTFKRGDKEVTNRYYPAARWVSDFAPQQPKLALDLVPAGTPGQFKVFFQGKPLHKAKVALVTQSGWAKEAHADEQGVVTFDMPWKGMYVAEVAHNDPNPGERQGANGVEKFTAVSYVTSVTYVKRDGVEPLPAGPAAKPNK
ncbi:DUF4198 domain-containing protein [Cupriavidus agavae]|uniref:Putative GH25 family protein n=1 Tax=Cupriavidus agavae TaxID=1001822 RepID=A0A4Q7RZB4_9BURK|nr:DUF4198 domain-containing protein [Cupriavidus agavae]RZT39241.1 putative GH25 family protein [Cupriavidus agavae]